MALAQSQDTGMTILLPKGRSGLQEARPPECWRPCGDKTATWAFISDKSYRNLETS